MINGILLGLVQSVLGKGNATSKGNYAFHCPLCNHRKPKLEINLVPTTKNENPWHCWACDAKGKTIASLFKSVKADREKEQQQQQEKNRGLPDAPPIIPAINANSEISFEKHI